MSHEGTSETADGIESLATRSDEAADQTLGHRPATHLALVFETEAEQLATVVPFVREGLAANERVVYVADQHTEQELREAFDGGGVDVEDAVASGALSIHDTDEVYGETGAFDPDAMVAHLEELIQDAVRDDGYNRLRITGEMTWALAGDADTLDNLVEYEGLLNDFYPERPVLGLCQYDRTAFPPALMAEIIRAHPQQLYDGPAAESVAYRSPEDLQSGSPPTTSAATDVPGHPTGRGNETDRQADHGETLRTLAESSEAILHGPVDGVGERAVTTLADALSPAVAALLSYDEAADTLRPTEVRTRNGGPSAPALTERYGGVCRDAFVSNDERRFARGDPRRADPPAGGPLESGLAVPLGRYGVLFVGATAPDAIDDGAAAFARTVAAATRAALDRAEREESLAATNERLRRLERVNRTIRHVDQALVAAQGRAEIESAVCELLAERDSYRFVWVGDRDPLTDHLVPRAWAGEGEPYLTELYARASGEPDAGTREEPDVIPSPVREAIESGEPVAVPNVLTATGFEQWRPVALDCGMYTALSVPLVHRRTEYGALTVYGAEPGAVSDLEREVLRELGETVAYAIDAAETSAARHTDKVTQVGLRLRDGQSRLRRLAAEIGTTLSVETVMPSSEGTSRFFFTVEDVSSARVLSVAEATPSVETVREVTDRERGGLFEAEISLEAGLTDMMAGYNATVADLTATGDAVELLVHLPLTADVRSFVDDFGESYPDTVVTSIQRIDRPGRSRASFAASVEERLTERQFEALQLAYHSGYFEWPRDSTSEEVAASMGVSQPTFNGHLRAGERKLLSLLFDE